MSKWIFAAIGGVIGFGVGYYYAKTRVNTEECDELYDEDENKEPEEKENTLDTSEEDVKTKVEYDSIIKKSGYSPKDGKEDGKGMVQDIYEISPDDMGDLDYKIMSLSYYNNHVLVDDVKNKVIKHPEEIIGEDFVRRFSNCENRDVVYIRNEAKKLDIEVLLDLDDYEG